MIMASVCYGQQYFPTSSYVTVENLGFIPNAMFSFKHIETNYNVAAWKVEGSTDSNIWKIITIHSNPFVGPLKSDMVVGIAIGPPNPNIYYRVEIMTTNRPIIPPPAPLNFRIYRVY